ncbi:C40 family peptidase [Calidifontibacter terrae]
MTTITPRHQKLRPGLTSRLAPAVTAHKTVILGGVVVAAPATALSVLSAAPAEALTVHTAGTAIKAAPVTQDITWLRYGDSGDLVKVMQQRIGGIAVDGQFGPMTLAKVKSFQAAKGLYVDGLVGPNTWQALGGFPTTVPADPPPTTTPPPTPQCEVTTVRYGSGGQLVQVLQQRLGGIAVDGDFGPATLARVKSYQTGKGLPSTGVVDSATWSALGGFPCGTATPTPPPPTTDPGTSTDKGQQIIALARQYLGVPYVWGGDDPSGFDCSGLTQYVYAKAGIAIPRVAHLQQNFLRPTSNPQPGDLVFFGSPAYHVGIYLGNNTEIAAPYPGQVVRVQPIYSTPSGYGTFR